MINHVFQKQYKGNLSTAQAAKGIEIARKNARDLLSDAELLFASEHWARACSLAILAIEEAGKPLFIRDILFARNEIELKKSWKEYRSHTKKNLMWIFPQVYAEGKRKFDDLIISIFDQSKGHGRIIEQLKQIGFYSDVYEGCDWSLPFTEIDSKVAGQIISVARLLVGKDSKTTTEFELDLWVKHIKPVWKTTPAKVKRAVLDFEVEARELGQGTNHMSLDEMRKFLGLDK